MHVTALFGVSINPDMETRAVVLQERWAGVFPGPGGVGTTGCTVQMVRAPMPRCSGTAIIIFRTGSAQKNSLNGNHLQNGGLQSKALYIAEPRYSELKGMGWGFLDKLVLVSKLRVVCSG